MVWIDNRGYPGGPLAFLVQQDSYWVAYMANIVPIIPAWLQDWLLVSVTGVSSSVTVI
jgi:hypothetical protein